jgi:PAS domain S-box-containing protein
VETKTIKAISLDNLLYLPKFASYLLTEKLNEYVQKQIQYSYEMEIPLLKFFLSLPEEQRFQITKQSSKEFLSYLASDKASEQIQNAMQQWKSDQLPIVGRDAIVAEDITLVNYVRKKTMLELVSGYTADPTLIIELAKEIDFFVIQSITAATNLFIGLYKERLDENSHFIQKVAETIPGAVYVFDREQFKGIYSNKKLADFIGYEQAELNQLGESTITTLIHPDDQGIFQDLRSADAHAKMNDGIQVMKYRIKTKNGSYKWLANYESPFKRKEDGSVYQTIGITLDINNEQKAVEDLHNREQLLLEAQEIAQLGHYYWDFEKNLSSGSSKTMELLEIEANDFESFIHKVHPDDRDKIKAATDKAYETGHFNCEYRIVGANATKVIWARGVMDYKNGKPVGMRGTVMDVTEHHKLIHQLELADKRHKQAEALAHIGTYSWNFLKDEIEWSDEMYAIHEADKNTIKPNYAFVLNAIHPEDRQMLDAVIKESIEQKKPYDFYYRIFTKSGKERILHSRGGIELNESGVPERVVGTDQDVTEKQSLIRALRKSEALYKQAEKIAAMGNWSWDVKTNKLEWTDQLYRIYGLEPQSEEVTIDRFLSFVHPDDRDFVEQGVTKLKTENSLDYTFRIITQDGAEKWLRSIAQVTRNEATKEIIQIIGTEQDVTEKQKLIGKLEESQRLYKQAQELARMGNFSWNLHTNDVYWSDEVYKIYEVPYGEQVKFEDAFKPIIDEYKVSVQKAIEETIATKSGRSISYAIRKKDGGLRYINLHTDVGLAKDGTISCIIGTAQDVTEKEELINRLQESEKLYKQAQSLASMGNWTYDLSTMTVTWSDELFAIYELPKGKPLTPEQWNSYLDPEDQKEMYVQLDNAVNHQKPLDVTHRVNLPNGKKKILHRKGEVVYDQTGKAIKVIGTTQDITEQFQTQSELKESQTFIRKITDATPSIISSYNINTGKYTFISEGLEKLLGYSTHEVMERGIDFFTGIIHPDDLSSLMEKNAKGLEEANTSEEKKDLVLEFTYRMKNKNGEYRWFHTYGTIFDYNQEGKVEHVLNISLDVTEQKEAIETIREQEYFIQQIADASPTILYMFDVPSQSMAYINREAFFVLGYLPDEIIEEGSNITRLLYHPDDVNLLPSRKQSSKNFQQVDSMIQYECRMKHKDGDYRWLLVREIVFKSDDNGSITQIIGAALDITRRKEMEKTILQNAHQLEQSNASLEEFAYVASHDLKEPLRKISTFGDRLVASQIDKLSDEGKIYLRKIVDASQRMQNMISDLLSISMISGNKSFERVNLQKLLEDTLQTLEFKIEQQKAVIRCDTLPEANVIPSQFRQLFQNLIANSLKFVQEGQQPLIVIKCALVSEKEIAPYQPAKAPSYLKISFTDNGIGFEMEYAQKIFAIFQRLHGRSEYEGSGIGLAICKKIVEHHGGVIFAAGQPNVGATFTIILPA